MNYMYMYINKGSYLIYEQNDQFVNLYTEFCVEIVIHL